MAQKEIGTTDQSIKASIERHRHADGSMVDEVIIRWGNGFIKIASESTKHAERILNALVDSPYVEITTWNAWSSQGTKRRKK